MYNFYNNLDDDTLQFIEDVQNEIDHGQLSDLTRDALLKAPPDGANVDPVEVLAVMHRAATAFNITAHPGWLDLWARPL